MKSLSKYRGFTLIEIVLVLAIVLILIGIGQTFGIQQYRSYLLQSDTDNVVSMLRSARSRAMNNINNSDHGVYFSDNEYILFQGPSYASRTSTYDEITEKSQIITVSGETEIVFEKLKGSVSYGSGTINISNNQKTESIELNDEGRISL